MAKQIIFGFMNSYFRFQRKIIKAVRIQQQQRGPSKIWVQLMYFFKSFLAPSGALVVIMV